MPKRTISPILFSLLALIFLLSPATPASQAQEEIWSTWFGSLRQEFSRAAAPDGNGGVMFAGYTLGDLAGASAGDNDAFLGRTNSAGETLWIRQFGSSTSDQIHDITPDGVGGVIITGRTNGSLGGTNAGGSDVFLARYDNEGNRLWIRQFGTIHDERAYALVPDGAGGVIFAGATYGDQSPTTWGRLDGILARYDGQGNRLWIRHFDRTELGEISALAPDGKGGVTVTGTRPPHTSNGEGFVARFDIAGNMGWVSVIGSGDGAYPTAIASDGAGGSIVAGLVRGSLGGPYAGGYDIFLASYDSEGNERWIRQIGSAKDDYAGALVPDGARNGGVIIAGWTRGKLGGSYAGGADAFLARYDSAGNQRWIRQFGERSTERVHDMAIDSAGSVVVLGTTNYNPNGLAEDHNILLARYTTGACYADCDESTGYGVLDIFDFLCFQHEFVAGCAAHRTSHRQSEWVQGGAHGTTLNNPSLDPLGRPAWSYEWATGGRLGSTSPWYAQPTQRSTWDEDWFGIGQGAWTQDDDVNPPIFQNRTSHNIAATRWSDIPIVRWLNPAGNGTQVDIAGSLTIRWAGEGGVGSPVDVDVVIARNDASQGTWDVLYSTTVSKPIQQPTIGDEIILPINLSGVALDEGDSIVISHRAASDSGSAGRWVVLMDDVAITGSASGCYADCDINGTLDIFDFLCFQDAFVAGCP